MELSRSIIKTQAKTLIKGKAVALFIIFCIVCVLATAGTVVSSVTDVYEEEMSLSSDADSGYNFQWDRSFFDDFTGNITPVSLSNNGDISLTDSVWVILSAIGDGLNLVELVFYALSIPMLAVFLQLIHGEYKGCKDSLKYIFTTYFDKNFFKRYFLLVVTTVAVSFASVFFVVPGLILYYRWYFAKWAMADKPGLKIGQALEISKKMTKGHKWELFKLDLSFIGWILLTGVTCGLAGIYVIPYMNTTVALYYENFKLRSMQEFKLSEADFMTEEERRQQYINSIVNANQNNQQKGYYNYGSDQSTDYFNSQF